MSGAVEAGAGWAVGPFRGCGWLARALQHLLMLGKKQIWVAQLLWKSFLAGSNSPGRSPAALFSVHITTDLPECRLLLQGERAQQSQPAGAASGNSSRQEQQGRSWRRQQQGQ